MGFENKKNMNTKKNGTVIVTSSEGHSVKDIFQRSITFDATWEDKDELLDVVYWMRQVVAILTGVVWGLIPLEGVLGLASFLALNCALVYVYVSKWQHIDEDEFGGLAEIVKEGLFTAFACFLVCWIITYTACF